MSQMSGERTNSCELSFVLHTQASACASTYPHAQKEIKWKFKKIKEIEDLPSMPEVQAWVASDKVLSH